MPKSVHPRQPRRCKRCPNRPPVSECIHSKAGRALIASVCMSALLAHSKILINHSLSLHAVLHPLKQLPSTANDPATGVGSTLAHQPERSEAAPASPPGNSRVFLLPTSPSTESREPSPRASSPVRVFRALCSCASRFTDYH